ncbi:hypothetical protein [Flavobacterium sp.]|uniref:hypothetical protein n=1 Tax=Flavobacterium sp. TaxID=239 RepID=UPI0037526B5B
MKKYFKYSNGFVNINDENLFLTNSGNWSETHDLLEKSPKSIRQNSLKQFKIYSFLVIIVCIGLLMMARSKNGFLPFGFIGIGVAAFFYMKRETGKRYKIPISKIKDIEINDDIAKIFFNNANNVEDCEEISSVETKGLSILKELNKNIKIN